MFHKSPEEITKNWRGNQPVVSICCITYNHENYIEKALNGFLMQETDFPFEIVIHDDASTDNTANIIKDYEKNYPDLFRPIYQMKNQKSKYKSGMNPRFNYSRAKGKYIALCDGDDYWTDPLKLQKQVDFLEGNEEVGIVHTKYKVLHEEKNEFEVHEKKIFSPSFSAFRNYLYTGDMRTMTVMFRSGFLKDIQKLLDEGIMTKMKYGDRTTFLTITSKSDIGYINEVTGVYRISNKITATRTTNLVDRYEIGLKRWESLKMLCDYLKIDDDEYRKLLDKRKVKCKIKLFILKIPILDKLFQYTYKKLKMNGRIDAY